jgi:hypothetical protein
MNRTHGETGDAPRPAFVWALIVAILIYVAFESGWFRTRPKIKTGPAAVWPEDIERGQPPLP